MDVYYIYEVRRKNTSSGYFIYIALGGATMYNALMIAALTWIAYKVLNSLWLVIVFTIYGAFRGMHYATKGINDQVIINYLITRDLGESKIIRVLCFWW